MDYLRRLWRELVEWPVFVVCSMASGVILFVVPRLAPGLPSPMVTISAAGLVTVPMHMAMRRVSRRPGE